VTCGTRADVRAALIAIGGVAAITWVYFAWLHVANATTVALSYLLLLLFVAASSRLLVAITASMVAAFAFDFYFLPPVGTLAIADPQNWMAFVTFLVVGLVASRLSSVARDRQGEAVARRDELGRLFDLSRDVLRATGGDEAMHRLAQSVAQRFALDYVAICLPSAAGFVRHESGTPGTEGSPTLKTANLERALGSAAPVVEIPLRHGVRAIGLLAVAGRPIEPATLDALASVVAIAIERLDLLEARTRAEISRRSVEIKSALLASITHDLRTPLTAIRLAVDNLAVPSLTDDQRCGQADVALTGVERLARLFENILKMSRIDAEVIEPALRWVHPPEVIEAARAQVEHALRAHKIELVDRSRGRAVRVDARLTSTALAHLLENAAQYSPVGSTITLTHDVLDDGLLISVRDHGAGLAESDLPHLFERFYRGEAAWQYASGTGMGLAITRGLLAAEGGRVWAEACADGGAQFSIFVTAGSRCDQTDPQRATISPLDGPLERLQPDRDRTPHLLPL
jgi:two-component system, OmpR family, sensor histidine kinase KdpD